MAPFFSAYLLMLLVIDQPYFYFKSISLTLDLMVCVTISKTV